MKLPEDADADHIQAYLETCCIYITIPKKKAASS